MSRDLGAEVAFLTRALKAPTLREAVPRLADRAREQSWSHEEFLIACLQREVAARESHGGEGRIRAARFPARKSLEEFDFDHARGLKRELIAHLGTLDFVTAKENVLLLGPPGTGKTYTGARLAVALMKAGKRVGIAANAHKAVINLLEELQDEFGLTYLVVAHDLAVVRHISDRIGVMYLGGLVEEATADDLYATPLHPYTRALLSAVPVPDPTVEDTREQILLTGDLPSPSNPPPGCRFHTRCPWRQPTRCASEVPVLRPVGPGGGLAACHFAEQVASGALTPTSTLAT